MIRAIEWRRLRDSRWAGLLLSALLAGLYARGGVAWLLGFVMLVPWLRTLDQQRSFGGTLLSAYAMSVAFTAAVFAWFGSAIGAYTQIGSSSGLLLLLLAAPLFQPQIIAFALVRQLVGRRHGRLLRALAAAAAWVAAEAWLPRLLGDTLGHGLYPSALLRQAADLGGATGLTLVLLLANEAVCAALAQRHTAGWRAALRPLTLAALLPLLLAGYGLYALSPAAAPVPAAAAKPLRMGLVQSNITDYERLRREKGAGAVVREVLDTHFAMSYDAIERQRADAVLWSETVYPTTFGQAKSEAGAEFDREILAIVAAARAPFVFGTYDRDAAGEYNAAAFVSPDTGLLGMYRKTRPFPLTEYVPAWLDGPRLRQLLPWAGSWLPGTGARVFPLRLADGREIPVLPLICLDGVDAGLAIDGARLGAQAILSLSNDSWFSGHAQGAALHQAVAAFRSIETRLPQFRVTSDGLSAVIDAHGRVIAGSRVGERTLVIGELPVSELQRPTLMLAWGDWVGRAAGLFLLGLALAVACQRWAARPAAAAGSAAALRWPAEVTVLPPAARWSAALLRAFARLALLYMIGAILLGDGALQSNTLAQIRAFAAVFLIPEAAAWLVLRAFSARATIADGALLLARGRQRLTLPLSSLAAVQPWRLPLPGNGAWLQLADGTRWRWGLACANPWALVQALQAEGWPVQLDEARAPALALAYARARLAVQRGWPDRLWLKFGILPLLLALPAFRLHQHIAYGSAFGEYYSYGLGAYLMAFALWWAAWSIGVVLCAAALRTLIELGTLAMLLLRRPAWTATARRGLEHAALAALYLGLPAWLLLRMLSP